MKTTFAFVVILYMAATAYGLSCITCNSFNEVTCMDPFSNDSAILQENLLMECDEHPEGLKPFCRKTRTYRNGDVRIHRECAYMEKVGYDCYQKRSDDYIRTICQCKEDGCNSASRMGWAVAVFGVSLLTMALL